MLCIHRLYEYFICHYNTNILSIFMFSFEGFSDFRKSFCGIESSF